MNGSDKLKIIVPVRRAEVQAPIQRDRQGGEQHSAEIISLNLSRYEATPVETASFLDKLMGPIDKAMRAIERSFKDFSLHEIKISLAVTAEGDIGIASAGVESSIEVTFQRREPVVPA
ncbi:MAG TPA: hypothetical protein VKB38_06700 [Terracidiphilus sp.]|nr:hypothetical protein [Terracidiphilus sp.]